MPKRVIGHAGEIIKTLLRRGLMLDRRSGRDYRLLLARGRLRIFGLLVVFLLGFAFMGGRVLMLPHTSKARTVALADRQTEARAEIYDRNGKLLAGNIPSWTLYLDRSALTKAGENPAEILERIEEFLPEIKKSAVLEQLENYAHVIIRRRLGPETRQSLEALGIAGLYMRETRARIYPHGRLLAHITGYVDANGAGRIGIEQSLNARLSQNSAPVYLSVNIGVQRILYQALAEAWRFNKAKSACGLVMDVRTGEVLALVSLPDFDPNHYGSANQEGWFNCAVQGGYEPGSTFKLFTFAMALQEGLIDLNEQFDTRKSLRIAGFEIRDFSMDSPRILTGREIFTHSSNIGAALIADRIGAARQTEYLWNFHLLDRLPIEQPVRFTPRLYNTRSRLTAMTIGFGHGVLTSPLHIAASAAAMVNGGIYRSPSLLRREETSGFIPGGAPVIDAEISYRLRQLLHRAVIEGTGKRAQVPGFAIGGKTGTAEKRARTISGYSQDRVLSSFIGVLPIDSPQYIVFVMLDEPQPVPRNDYQISAGIVAAPIAANVLAQLGGLLGVEPATQPLETLATTGEEKGSPPKPRADFAQNPLQKAVSYGEAREF